MKKQSYTTVINASSEKIWKILWDDKTYREWTSVFSEGSFAESDWKEGSRVLFLNPQREGMFSRIIKLDPNKTMIFEHLGMIKNGVEQPETEETKGWAGAQEGYYLEENNGKTELKVVMDINESHLDYFNDAFPKALQKVKELSEKN